MVRSFLAESFLRMDLQREELVMMERKRILPLITVFGLMMGSRTEKMGTLRPSTANTSTREQFIMR